MKLNANRILAGNIETFNSILYIQWHITNLCNEACMHCYITEKKDAMPYEDKLLILRKIIEYSEIIKKDVFIAFTGGDPLLDPDIWKLCEYCNKHGIGILIKGNPHQIIDNNAIEQLTKFNIISYQMSIDGKRITHDTLRSAGSYDKTVLAFCKLKETGIKTVCKFDIAKINIHELVDVAAIVDDLNIDYFGVSRIVVVGNAHSNQVKTITKHEYNEIMETVANFAFKYTSFIFYDPLWQPFFLRKGMLDIGSLAEYADTTRPVAGCSIWEDSYCIDNEGNVLACAKIPSSRIGNLLLNTFSDIVQGSLLAHYRKITLIQGCNICKLAAVCRGCRAHDCFAHSPSNTFAKDIYCFGPVTSL